MAKFHGLVGFVEENVETAPGVWENVMVTRPYFGDITKINRILREGDEINNDLTVSNSISIVADPYALNHFFAIRYVEWAGVRWDVPDVSVSSPRLLLRLGGVYNGPTPPPVTGVSPEPPA